MVILLGWGGCRDKNLAKYSAIYHKRVSVVCRCLPRLWASATLGRFVGNWRPGCFTFGLEQRLITCVVALEPCQRPVGDSGLLALWQAYTMPSCGCVSPLTFFFPRGLDVFPGCEVSPRPTPHTLDRASLDGRSQDRAHQA